MVLINFTMKQEKWREAKAVIYKRNSAVTMVAGMKRVDHFCDLTMSILFVCVQTWWQSGLVLLLLQRHRAPLSNAPILWNCLYATGEHHSLAVNARPTLVRNTEVEQIGSVGQFLPPSARSCSSHPHRKSQCEERCNKQTKKQVFMISKRSRL